MDEDQENQSQDSTQEVQETEVIKETHAAQKEYSEAEKLAIEQGWVPEDQWDGRGKWRSAEDFLERGEIFSKMDSHKRRADRLEQTVEDMKKHLHKIRDIEFKRAMDHLKAQKRDALTEGDADRVMQIDEAIEQTRAEAHKAAFESQQQRQEAEPDPYFTSWANRNSWYNTERAMKLYADEVGAKLSNAGERDPKKILQEVERQVKKEFSHKFNNPNRERASTVEGGNSKGNRSTKESFQLSAEETQVMNRFVKAGVMSKEQYIAEIKASRGA
jgi:hypothetical protein